MYISAGRRKGRPKGVDETYPRPVSSILTSSLRLDLENRGPPEPN